MVENKTDNSNIVGSEILIYQTEDGHTRHNYANYTKPVNLISVSILNISLKKTS